MLCLLPFKTMQTIVFDLDGTLLRLRPESVLIADIKRLQALQSNYRLAIVSGGTREEVLQALEETDLRRFFADKHIVTFEDTNQEKSSGEPFREILRRLPRPMVMIGDSDGDEIGTRIAEIPFVRVETYQAVQAQKAALERAIQMAVKLFELSSS